MKPSMPSTESPSIQSIRESCHRAFSRKPSPRASSSPKEPLASQSSPSSSPVQPQLENKIYNNRPSYSSPKLNSSSHHATPSSTKKYYGINPVNGAECLACIRKGDFCKAHEYQKRRRSSPRGSPGQTDNTLSRGSPSTSPSIQKKSHPPRARNHASRRAHNENSRNGGREGRRLRATNINENNDSMMRQRRNWRHQHQVYPSNPPFGKVEVESSSSTTTRQTNATSSRKTNRRKLELAVAMKKILKLKKEGENRGKKHLHVESIHKFTIAILEIRKFCVVGNCNADPDDEDDDDVRYLEVLAAELLSNRAVGLIGVGAYQACVDDCREALKYLTTANTALAGINIRRGESIKRFDLQVVLHNGMGRALLKLGDVDSAIDHFSTGIEVAIMQLSTYHNGEENSSGDQIVQRESIQKSIVTAKEGKRLSSQLRLQLRQISDSNNRRNKNPLKALGYINAALKIADGCKQLYLDKVLLLVQDNRWHELAHCCEQVMCRNIKFDGCFEYGDLASKYPVYSKTTNDGEHDTIASPPPAQALTSDFFQGDHDEIARRMLSNPDQIKEGIVRLPDFLVIYYLKALRLEKRFTAVQVALEALLRQDLSRFGNSILEEHELLDRTLSSFNKGRAQFQKEDFSGAQKSFEICERFTNNDDNKGGNELIGGRFHAMMRYNRAICKMKMNQYQDAINLCSLALRIHSLYMNPIKARAQCYAELGQLAKAIDDYQLWIQLSKHAKNDPSFVLKSRCRFDGPDQVSEDEISEIRKRMEKLLARQQQEQNRKAEEEEPRKSSSQKKEKDGTRPPKPDKDDQITLSFTNPYNVLGLNPGASQTEIKKAYRSLVLQHHPDKNKSPGATEMFRKIQVAYETLSKDTTG